MRRSVTFIGQEALPAIEMEKRLTCCTSLQSVFSVKFTQRSSCSFSKDLRYLMIKRRHSSVRAAHPSRIRVNKFGKFLQINLIPKLVIFLQSVRSRDCRVGMEEMYFSV